MEYRPAQASCRTKPKPDRGGGLSALRPCRAPSAQLAPLQAPALPCRLAMEAAAALSPPRVALDARSLFSSPRSLPASPSSQLRLAARPRALAAARPRFLSPHRDPAADGGRGARDVVAMVRPALRVPERRRANSVRLEWADA